MDFVDETLVADKVGNSVTVSIFFSVIKVSILYSVTNVSIAK